VSDLASARIAAAGLVLPPPPRPVGSYVPVAVAGSLAWVAGQIVTEGGRAAPAGRVGESLDVPAAQAVARRCALQAVSALTARLGSVDRVRRVVRLGVYVAGAPGFDRAHEVANGASDLLVEVFGEAGRGARVALTVAALPLGAPVEVELAVEVAGSDG
jgi:enamine deaminase RidA (YjgF/YER057c/UK114 family)